MTQQAIVYPAVDQHIDPLALDEFRWRLQGHAYLPGDIGYDEARAGFSLTDLPSPDVVVVATCADDVVSAVNFARAQRLPVGVNATGHNFGFPYQGGLMINLSRMQGVAIDADKRTARVEGGVTWAPVIAEAQRYGLAPLNGSGPHIGVVGYTLFGGFGWLLRKYGAAVDSVIAVEVVTADGQLRHVSETSNPDLFWALRGGSGNFGVVTALEFKLYPVTEVYGGSLFFPLEHAREVLAGYSQWVETVPDETTSSIALVRLPPIPALPETLRGKAVVLVRAAYTGTEADGATLLQPMRALGGLIADTFRVLPYTEIGTISNDPVQPVAAWRTTMMLQDLSPATIDTVVRVDGIESSTPVKMIEIRHLGGAMSRVSPETNSFSQRYAPFIFQAADGLGSPEQDEVVKRNMRVVWEALQPHATGGVLPSWLGSGDYGVDRTRAGFSPEHYERLVALKDHYDPTNMFRLNHNIPPSR